MEINEIKLRDLLARRAKYIKSNKDIFETLLVFLGYIASVLLSGIFTTEIDIKIKIFIGFLAVIYFVLFLVSIKNSRYSVETLYREIVSCNDNHNFSLVILKNSNGRFLLKWDRRWKTYLFPYIRTKENDLDSVQNFIKTDIGFEPLELLKKTEADFTKTSVSANMMKTYHHTFYQFSFNCETEKAKFKFNGTKYRWLSIDEMKQDKNILEKNSENIRFVEEQF